MTDSMEPKENELLGKGEIFYHWDFSAEDNGEMTDEEKTKIEDQMWKARTGLNDDTLCGAIETILFLNDKPLSIQALKAQIDEEVPLRVIHQSIARLQAGYEEKHHGIRLMEVAEGFQFRTKATYAKFVQDLFKVNAITLTPLALEVLAMIAYKQPMSKTDIDALRGVDSSHLIRGLMDKRLVKIVGRSEDLGKPTLYGTTPEFLEVFNLADLSALPSYAELEELSQANTVGNISDIKTIVQRDEQVKFNFDDIDELDELADKIKNISTHTEFTKLLKDENSKSGKVNEETGEAYEAKSAFELLETFITPVENKLSDEEITGNAHVPGEIADKVAELKNKFLEATQAHDNLEPSVFSDEVELSDMLDQAFSDLTERTEKIEKEMAENGEHMSVSAEESEEEETTEDDAWSELTDEDLKKLRDLE
jgi:segregation and condensation protein B